MSNLVKVQRRPITLVKVFRYFIKGLIVLAPITITIYIIIMALRWVDSLIPAIEIPGVGFLIIVASITAVGYITSSFISKSVFEYVEKGILRIPLIGLIYTSLKELTGAFVGDKKKFNKPVIVSIDNHGVLQRLGFVTQENLSNLGIEDKIAVYFPHSYNFSGNFFLVPKKNVTPIKVSNTHFMKFIVSGGMTAIPKAAFDD